MNKEALETFIERVNGFESFSHTEKVILFGYYLQELEKLDKFHSNLILECYSTLDLPPPVNIADVLSKARQKKRLIVKDDGYRLSKTEADRIEELLESPGLEFTAEEMMYVPSHSLESVKEAVQHISQLERKKQFHPGLYYIVLIDLVGSTKASTELKPEENITRINQFVDFTKQAWRKTRHPERAQFIKDIGDASLFTFNNFEDILEWSRNVDELLAAYNKECEQLGRPTIYQMFTKKCVHLGEVHFDKVSNPIAFAINQVFKIEKEFTKDQLGITDSVKQVILPRIKSKQVSIIKVKEVPLAGDPNPSPLWIISIQPS